MSAQTEELRQPALSDEQRARGQALLIARDVLANSAAFSSDLASRTAGDIVYVAEWVLSGGPDASEEQSDQSVLSAVQEGQRELLMWVHRCSFPQGGVHGDSAINLRAAVKAHARELGFDLFRERM